jgi:hypothetical protein
MTDELDELTEVLNKWKEGSTFAQKFLDDHEEIRGMLNLSDDALGALSKTNAWVGTAIGVLK